jgi:hypothetical protein
MTAAAELLDRLTEIGATVHPAGAGRLLVRAGANPVPAELVRRLREAKVEILAALAPAVAPSHVPLDDHAIDPAWWRREFMVRTLSWELAGTRSQAVAQWLAWGQIEDRWHRSYGERVARDLCAGCRRPLAGAEALDMIDGNRVHLASLDCLVRHGERWRHAATRALAAMGLQPPGADNVT